METILDVLEVRKAVPNVKYAQKLKDCGFPASVEGYAQISLANIRAYLTKLAIQRSGKFIVEVFDKHFAFRDHGYIETGYHLSGRRSLWTETRREITWREENINFQTFFPPEHVLDSIQRAKKDFDQIKIVTIEEREIPPVPDPLVVGLKNGDDTRYLIDWWDTDIDPSELV